MTGRATPLWPEGLSEISVYTVLPRPRESAPAVERREDEVGAETPAGELVLAEA